MTMVQWIVRQWMIRHNIQRDEEELINHDKGFFIRKGGQGGHCRMSGWLGVLD